MAKRGERARAIVERHDAALSRAEQRAIERVNAALDKSYRDMERDLLASYQKHGANTDLLPRQRALVIMDEIRQQSELLNPQQGETIQQNYEAMIKAAHREGADLAGDLATALGDRRLMPFSEIPMDAVVAQARDGVRRLAGHGAAFASKASAVVEQGLIQGWGARRVGTALRAELGVTKSKAETIARTEVMSAYNSAAKDRYKRSGIELGQWLATRSDRLCPVCADRNMRTFRIDEIVIPAHPRCRCTLLPVSADWDNDLAFTEEYRNRTLADLIESGQEPLDGLSPFEKASGVTSPPTPVSIYPVPKGGLKEGLKLEEDSIRFLKYETGVTLSPNGQVLERVTQWDPTSVGIPDSHLRMMDGAIYTHNHPDIPGAGKWSPAGFSRGDVDVLVSANTKEFRAVDPQFSYSLRNNDLNKTRASSADARSRKMLEIYDAADEKVGKKLQDMVLAGELDAREANFVHGHLAAREFAAMSNGQYSYSLKVVGKDALPIQGYELLYDEFKG